MLSLVKSIFWTSNGMLFHTLTTQSNLIVSKLQEKKLQHLFFIGIWGALTVTLEWFCYKLLTWQSHMGVGECIAHTFLDVGGCIISSKITKNQLHSTIINIVLHLGSEKVMHEIVALFSDHHTHISVHLPILFPLICIKVASEQRAKNKLYR